MRIGQIVPPWVPVPPPAYGGTEAVVGNLAVGLDRLGHDVHLFTVGESTCPVRRYSLYEHPTTQIGVGEAELMHVLAAYETLADADIIHDHTSLGPFVGALEHSPPVVVTNHGPFSEMRQELFRSMARHASIVAISEAQRRMAGSVPIAEVIHHGIDLDAHRFGPGGGGYVIFVGRMNETKGVHRAVQIARLARRKLLMITKMREPEERRYYTERVRPLMGPDDPEPREEATERRVDLVRHADALINPIEWPEPFGLVMAEALACGTPVLAFPNGAAPEIVEDGKTGFLCRDAGEMADALDRLHTIDRRDCRAAAEQRFGRLRMARDHERLYRRIVAERTTRVMAPTTVA
ncbi:glycosyltransferase family 4 protein [Nocardia colli]|uniref:Glycosyltransferase family 4 protein n=1 Tax=Nocardia colli TaxID=2545717 RepID=A0A5N0DTW1_9NOCA|nr:glycosyltransferase family 4 protein [Nocardia colli]KAA8880527.1 glycosyltransferase family 4 protein [Nocardia colli]